MGTKDKDIEWENRVLCSDESCIGVIGSDGRCKECGLVYQGELPTALEPSASSENGDDVPSPVEEIDKEEPLAASDADDEWSRRTLCRDESCIGVIGPDGRCKECGKPY
jgi:rubredoxin